MPHTKAVRISPHDPIHSRKTRNMADGEIPSGLRGSNTYLANGHCYTPPKCQGTGQLKLGEEIWRKGPNMWKTKDGSKLYCNVTCPAGSKLTHKSGDTHFCKPEASNCFVDIHLKPGEEIWKKAANMWKPKNSDRCYTKAICTEGSVLTHKGGDTHYCKPGGQADQCKGSHRSLPGGTKKLANEGQGITLDRDSWVFYGIGGCYNKRDFGRGARFACANSVFGDPLPGSFKACYAMQK